MIADAWTEQIDGLIEQMQPEVVRIRRHLHAHPEPSGEEIETTQFVRQRLADVGIESQTYQSDAGAEVGLTADVNIGEPASDAPLIAIRCDLDALRIPDQKQVEYRSQIVNVCHACGHDAHSAMVLGLGLLASQLANGRARLPGGLRLRLIFQPAEETSGGARWMLDQGAMNGVNGILGLHVDPERPAGEVGIRYGFLTAFCDEVDIGILGHGGHAARPHHSVDPILCSAQLITSLYQYLPRSVDSRDASVFTIGQVNGGYAPNVIPEELTMRGSLRTTNLLMREALKKRIREICDGIEKSSHARIDVRFSAPLDAVDNHPTFATGLERAAREVIGEKRAKLIDRPSLGGEDFSVYLEQAHGALLRLGCGTAGKPQPYLHSPLFDINEECLSIGMKILLRAACFVADELAVSKEEPS